MTLLQLRLLGGFDCLSATGEPVRMATRKVEALLAYLALSPGRAHPRDHLVALFWGERDETSARADLRKTLSRLRQALPEVDRARLVGGAAALGLGPGVVDVDVARFARLVADGVPEALERAVALYRGELLAGLGELGEGFDGWLAGERRRLEEMLRSALARLLDHYVVTGGIERAIELALRLLALDPLQESVHRTLIRLYLRDHGRTIAGELHVGSLTVDPAHAAWLDDDGFAQVVDRTLPSTEELLGTLRLVGEGRAPVSHASRSATARAASRCSASTSRSGATPPVRPGRSAASHRVARRRFSPQNTRLPSGAPRSFDRPQPS